MGSGAARAQGCAPLRFGADKTNDDENAEAGERDGQAGGAGP